MSFPSMMYSYFNSFGINGYLEDNIPQGAELPYITYPLISTDNFDKTPFNIKVYYSGTSVVPCFNKAQEILKNIGNGKTFKDENILITLFKGNTPLQVTSLDEVMLGYIQTEINVVELPQ